MPKKEERPHVLKAMAGIEKWTRMEAENKLLRQMFIDISWMARRYVDGRRTYAVSMYNDAVKQALSLGIELSENDGTIWARDGDFGLPEDIAAYFRELKEDILNAVDDYADSVREDMQCPSTRNRQHMTKMLHKLEDLVDKIKE